MTVILGLFAVIGAPQAGERVTVFAAASVKPALDALTPTWQARGLDVRAVYAGTSALARQIEHGAPADVFVSANAGWMDHLQTRGLIVPDSRADVATNVLVLATGTDPFPAPLMAFGPGYPLRPTLGGARLAIADPDHVPAGMYGREALKTLGLWDGVEDRLARTQDVTGALMMLARGEARLGVVYASDVGRAEGVAVFAPFPTDSHAPIVYPAAVVADHDGPGARAVLAVLAGAEGQAAFRSAGFGGAP
ncbi:MAG: molybdate ABC transporter substrate-binding protein [Alphaproteobacteria bacterium]|nr:molybdate ABC transporter substrate-binding protein [Alphaproteobacteria bacterium]